MERGKMKNGLWLPPDCKTYWAQWRSNGKTYRRATGCTKLEDAKAWRAERIAESAKGTFVPHAKDVTYEDLKTLFEDAATARGNRSRPKWKHLDRAFSGVRALAMNVASYEADRLRQGAARATVNQELAALRRMFRLAAERKLLSRDQIPVIRTPDPKNARKGFVTDKQFAAVRDALPSHLRGVWEFMYLTGWRGRSEVLPLTWANIDLKAKLVRLETSKNGEAREFPFETYPPLRALLDRQRASAAKIERERGHEVHHVFHTPRGGEIKYETWNDARQAATKAAGVSALAHDLRRTAVRNLERQGVSRSVAMSLTGHKTEAVYRRYAIVDSAAQREGVAKLAKLFEPEAARV